MAPPQEFIHDEFTLLNEQPPQSLLRRLLTVLRHLGGLLFGGVAAFVRDKRAQKQDRTLGMILLRVLLFAVRPLLDQRIIQHPFPIQFRIRLEILGPTYIKLGQILSLRRDILPASITDELQNLLDRLPVVTFDRYKELIEADLNASVDNCFEWIDPKPLGSASLAQIHRARLFSGEDVVLKVIKPGVRETVQQDTILLRVVGWLLQRVLGRYQPQRIINEFSAYTLREVDLRFEADNAETFAANFRENPNVVFPRIYREFSGRDVLCMEYFAGIKPTALAAAKLSQTERSQFLDLGISSILQMIFHDGFFHADLHPGNLIIFPDMRIGFIDLGMVGRVDEATRRAMLYYFYSLVMGDPANAARILSVLALPGSNADINGLRRELTDLNRRWVSASKYHRFSVTQLVLRSINLAGRYRVYYPEEIILMTKALVTIEGVGLLLDPDLELTVVARKHIQAILRSEFDLARLWRQTVINAPELMDILRRSPLIVARVLHRLENEDLGPHPVHFPGLKEIVLAGFGLIAIAILVSAGVPWPVWLVFIVLILLLALRGLGAR
ncbi:MAG: AarF/ABC1/UbiB kinase family protein [Caldilineaceae bacterium]|nr:AarF/ABC1/UbiB kinase family protein [Caldilineaceae bacterium]